MRVTNNKEIKLINCVFFFKTTSKTKSRGKVAQQAR